VAVETADPPGLLGHLDSLVLQESLAERWARGQHTSCVCFDSCLPLCMLVYSWRRFTWTAICITYTFVLCILRTINVFCWSRVHYAADQYSIGHLAWWRWKLLIIITDLHQGNAGSDGPPGRDGATGTKVRKTLYKIRKSKPRCCGLLYLNCVSFHICYDSGLVYVCLGNVLQMCWNWNFIRDRNTFAHRLADNTISFKSRTCILYLIHHVYLELPV